MHVAVRWVGSGWVGSGWVGLGWVGLGWVGLGWGGLEWVVWCVEATGQCRGGLSWAGLGLCLRVEKPEYSCGELADQVDAWLVVSVVKLGKRDRLQLIEL